MKHPLLTASACLMSGVVLSDAVGADAMPGNEIPGTAAQVSTAILSVSFAAGSLASYLTGKRLDRRSAFSPSTVFYSASSALALVLAGVFLASAARIQRPDDIARWTAVPVRIVLSGRLRSDIIRSSGSRELTIDAKRIEYDSVGFAVSGRVLVRDWDGEFRATSPLHPGDSLAIEGWLRPIPAQTNPFDFDARSYHRRSGISAILDPARPMIHANAHLHEDFRYRMERLRASLRTRIRKSYRTTAARELLPALLMGDRSRLERDTGDDFRTAGLAHLLAISGLHVGIVGMSLFWVSGLLCGHFRIPYRRAAGIRVLFTLSVLVGYAILSGGAPSVFRAVAMAAMLLVGWYTERRSSGWNALGCAAMLVIALRPDDIYSVGYRLSFAAVGSIFVLSRARSRPGIRTALSRARPKWIVDSVLVSMAVTAGTLPVLLYHFGVAALGGIAGNLVAIPVTALLLIAALLSMVVGGPVLVGATDLLSVILFEVARLASVWFGSVSLWTPVGVLLPLSLTPLVLLFVSAGRRRTVSFVLLATAGLWLVRPTPFPEPWPRTDTGLRIDALDVGQGDAIFISTPAGRTMIVDSGRSSASGRTIVRHARGLGFKRVDVLLLTHLHQDHTGGVEEIVTNLPVHRLMLPVGAGTEWIERFARLPGPASSSSIGNVDGSPNAIGPASVHEVARGDTLYVDAQTRIHVLAPGTRGAEGNAASIVLQIAYGTTRLLLLGDAEAKSEAEIVRQFTPLLPSDVVKVAHHGSSTSSIESLVRRSVLNGMNATTKPTTNATTNAIVSVSVNNRFGHPDNSVIRRWSTWRARVLSTAREGCISLRSDGTRFQRIDWR